MRKLSFQYKKIKVYRSVPPGGWCANEHAFVCDFSVGAEGKHLNVLFRVQWGTSAHTSHMQSSFWELMRELLGEQVIIGWCWFVCLKFLLLLSHTLAIYYFMSRPNAQSWGGYHQKQVWKGGERGWKHQKCFQMCLVCVCEHVCAVSLDL